MSHNYQPQLLATKEKRNISWVPSRASWRHNPRPSASENSIIITSTDPSASRAVGKRRRRPRPRRGPGPWHWARLGVGQLSIMYRQRRRDDGRLTTGRVVRQRRLANGSSFKTIRWDSARCASFVSCFVRRSAIQRHVVRVSRLRDPTQLNSTQPNSHETLAIH